MPRLSDELDAHFIRVAGDGYEIVSRLSHAQGVVFLCPRCFMEKGRAKYGVHSVVCWFANRNVPTTFEPRGRWNASGKPIEQPDGKIVYADTLDDLSFIGPGSFSVRIAEGCKWHGYIKDGRATILPS
jgi:hypothetical protein